ncbi:SRPBCC family protein [Nocardia jejuensis]|uniref:SRPBCC family protein n=1 Tax=Nocardia jejuensis TaxID=328049 RepID=UPI00082C6C76|nr:SRPBCC family protein [Nocardia jejuensis]
MSTFENTLTIRRAPEDVFAYLAAFENVPRWNYAITDTVKTSDGPVGVGSRYRQTRTIPDHAVEEFEVVRFEPAERLTIRGQLGPFPATVSYDLSRTADGNTLLRNVIELQVRGALRLGGPVLTSRVRSAVGANLDVLRKLLEE